MTPSLEVSAAHASVLSSLAGDVRHYVTQTPRQLPSRGLYDTLGSALFDAICHLPWYPVTRAERRLIAAHRADIFAAAGAPERLVELGPGNGEKLNLLLGPPDHGSASAVRHIDLVDVSPSALHAAARLLTEGRTLIVMPHPMRYEDGLARAAAARTPGDRLCVLFLGSNIGNFDPPGAGAFLQTIRGVLRPDDALVIGADLVKPERDLLLAYDDPLGVTAAFNRNLLVRINRELGGSFDLDAFAHVAVWNPAHDRVEMHLESRVAQTVRVGGAPGSGAAAWSVAFTRGERIWTESSYKYEPSRIDEMGFAAGFVTTEQWIDDEARFALTLFTAI